MLLPDDLPEAWSISLSQIPLAQQSQGKKLFVHLKVGPSLVEVWLLFPKDLPAKDAEDGQGADFKM